MSRPRFLLFLSRSILVACAELLGDNQISLNVPSALSTFVYAKKTNPSSRVSPRWNLSPVIGLTRLISIQLIQTSLKSYAAGKNCRFTRLVAICRLIPGSPAKIAGLLHRLHRSHGSKPTYLFSFFFMSKKRKGVGGLRPVRPVQPVQEVHQSSARFGSVSIPIS